MSVDKLYRVAQAEGWAVSITADLSVPRSFFAAVTIPGNDQLVLFSGRSKVSIVAAERVAAMAALASLSPDAEQGSPVPDNAVSALNELMQKRGLTPSWRSKLSPEQFTATARLAGQEVAMEQAGSKQEAEDAAAAAALRTLAPEPRVAFAEEITEVVLRQARLQLSAPFTDSLREVFYVGVIAGFVQTSPAAPPECVSLGFGTAHASEAEVVRPSERLLDCHAEVLARRALLLYFHRQLRSAQQGASSIFDRQPKDQQHQAYVLREGIVFHLYVSELPCGDASVCCPRPQVRERPCIAAKSLNGAGPALPSGVECAHWPSFKRDTQGLVRCKLVLGESLTPVTRGGLDAEPRIRKVSCSDKLMRWNVLGLQGAMLSHLILEPVFMSTVVIKSDRFWHGDVVRALCCRAARWVGPGLLHIHHPRLLQSHYYHPEFMPQTPPTGNKRAAAKLAATWTRGEPKLELIADAKKGFLRGTKLDPKDAISALNEYAQEQFLKISFEFVEPCIQPLQRCTVTVDNVPYSGASPTKQEAKRSAAGLALNQLLGRSESEVSQMRLYASFWELSGGRPYESAKKGSTSYAEAKASLINHLRENGQDWPQRRHTLRSQDEIEQLMKRASNGV